MPNWKKVVVSGSNAELNQVTASYFTGDGSALTNLAGSPIKITIVQVIIELSHHLIVAQSIQNKI